MRFTLGRWLIGVIMFSTLSLLATLFSLTQFQYESEDAIEKVIASVVQIGMLKEPDTRIYTVGGGVIISKNGYVLTVKHNLNRGDHFFVKTQDGRSFPVVYYVADAHRDLAVLRVDFGKVEVSTTEIGDTRTLRVGQTVFAIGYPSPDFINDDSPTVSRGIVSALNRILVQPEIAIEEEKNNEEVEASNLEWMIEYTDTPDNRSKLNISMTPMIQTDTMVNSGSSGGPLITTDGHVVGVVQSMISDTGSNVGLNFAIPVSEADILLKIAGVREAK